MTEQHKCEICEKTLSSTMFSNHTFICDEDWTKKMENDRMKRIQYLLTSRFFFDSMEEVAKEESRRYTTEIRNVLSNYGKRMKTEK